MRHALSHDESYNWIVNQKELRSSLGLFVLGVERFEQGVTFFFQDTRILDASKSSNPACRLFMYLEKRSHLILVV